MIHAALRRSNTRSRTSCVWYDSGASELRLLDREAGPWAGELRAKRWSDETAAFMAHSLPLLFGWFGQPTAGPAINRPVVSS